MMKICRICALDIGNLDEVAEARHLANCAVNMCLKLNDEMMEMHKRLKAAREALKPLERRQS